jgi:hypothetical protein
MHWKGEANVSALLLVYRPTLARIGAGGLGDPSDCCKVAEGGAHATAPDA